MLRRPRLLGRQRRAALVARRGAVAVERDGVGERLRLRGHGSQPTLAPWRSRSSASPASRAGSCSTRRGARDSSAARRPAAGGWRSSPRPGGARRGRTRRDGAAGRVRCRSSRRSPARSSRSASSRPAAIAVGAHYLDTSGEQEWVALLHASSGRRRPCCPRSASTTSRRPRRPARRGAGRGPARRDRRRLLGQGRRHEPGTRRTIGHVMGQKQVAWEDGRSLRRASERRRAGALPLRRARRRRVGGTEPLTVRGTPTSATFARTSGSRHRGESRRARPARRAARPPRLAARPVGARRRRPGAEPLHGRRRGARAGRRGRAVVEGTDVYGNGRPDRRRRPGARRR